MLKIKSLLPGILEMYSRVTCCSFMVAARVFNVVARV